MSNLDIRSELIKRSLIRAAVDWKIKSEVTLQMLEHLLNAAFDATAAAHDLETQENEYLANLGRKRIEQYYAYSGQVYDYLRQMEESEQWRPSSIVQIFQHIERHATNAFLEWLKGAN